MSIIANERACRRLVVGAGFSVASGPSNPKWHCAQLGISLASIGYLQCPALAFGIAVCPREGHTTSGPSMQIRRRTYTSQLEVAAVSCRFPNVDPCFCAAATHIISVDPVLDAAKPRGGAATIVHHYALDLPLP